MSDPAVEAAQRVWAGRYPNAGYTPSKNAVAAAREALAPLRAKHQRVQRPDGSYRCTSCRDAYGGHADWPTGTDRLIYSSDELEGTNI